MQNLKEKNQRRKLLEKQALIANQRLINKAKESFLGFVVYTFPEFEISWHHYVLAHFLERWIDGDINRLIIVAPPRHTKSEFVSRRLPAYIFGKYPDAKIISASYTAALATKMSLDCQKIMDSTLYYDVFPETRIASDGSNPLDPRPKVLGKWVRHAEAFQVANKKGEYISAGEGGSVTGMGADFIIIDDPVKDHKEAASELYRQRVYDWYTSTLYTRLQGKNRLLLTMTRWHYDDLVGRLLEKMDKDEEADKFVVLELPALKTGGFICEDARGQLGEQPPHPIKIKDKRAEEGEALWPTRFSKQKLNSIKNTLGSYFFSSLYLGSPATDGGVLFKSNHFRYYTRDRQTNKYLCHRHGGKDPLTINHKQLIRFCYVDPSLGENKKTNDPMGMQAWGYCRNNNVWILLDRFCDYIDFNKILDVILSFASKNRCSKIGIENEKLGKVISKISVGKDRIDNSFIPFVEVPTNNIDKFTRAIPMSAYIEAERVFFPTDVEWLKDFEHNLTVFPYGKHDEDVDVLAYAANMQTEQSTTQMLCSNNGNGLQNLKSIMGL